MRAARTTSRASGVRLGDVGERRGHWTAISTGVTSQFFGLTRVKAPVTETVLPVSALVSMPARTASFMALLMADAGVLVLDLVLEVAELDLAGGVAQVGAVDRRAGLHADLRLAGQAGDVDVVDAGLALADDAGELDREDRADAGGDAVRLGGGGLVGGDGLGELGGVDGAAERCCP